MKHISALALAIGLLSGFAAESAFAASGVTLIGYGPRQKALAGAGVADSRDPMALSVNPAGIIGMGRQMQFGISAILPERGYNAIGATKLVAPGDVRSGRPIFPVPNGAYINQIDATSAWGAVSYGNGGINTGYDFGHFKPPVTAFGGAVLVSPSAGGPLGGGFAGFDLQQSFFSVAYARRFGNLSIGVAPTVAVQMLNVQGLKRLAFVSADASSLSDNGADWSWGGGVRAGLDYRFNDQLRFGFGAQTPMFMSHFKKYQGLFADAGKLDIPAHLQAGVAYDVLPNVTVMVDWKHIFYGMIPSLHNPSFPIWHASLGSRNGPGLSWRDTDMESFGVEWRNALVKNLTLRGGYAYSSNPIPSYAVSLNVLAPAISAHHLSGGFKYEATANSSIDFAAVYVFKNSINGVEGLPYVARALAPNVAVNSLPQPNPYSSVTAWARGLEFSLGYTYKFDAGDNSWIPSHL